MENELVFVPQESIMRMVDKGAFSSVKEAIVYFGPDAGEFVSVADMNEAAWTMVAWMQAVSIVMPGGGGDNYD